MTTQDSTVPKYFANFMQENARQHQDLSDRISSSHTELSSRISRLEGEMRILIGVGIATFAVAAAAGAKYIFEL